MRRSFHILLWALSILGCSSVKQQPVQEELNFGKPIVSDVAIEPFWKIIGTHSGWVFLRREKDAMHLWKSDLRAQSLQAMPTLSRVPPACDYDREHQDLHLVQFEADKIWHVRMDLDGRTTRNLIAEGLEPVFSLTSLVCANRNRVGLAWIDKTSGHPELRFAHSSDHGQTWSSAIRINTESRGKETFTPVLYFQQNRWYIAWPENRSEETLFDIYLSKSLDGKTWIPGLRINDDQQYAWNWAPSLAGNNRELFVVFGDYREKNRFGDFDENVYAARVAPNDSVSRNVRVNDATEAFQTYPRALYDEPSGLLIAAWADQRRHLLGDFYISFSKDGGATWAPNRRLNTNDEPRRVSGPFITARPDDGAYVGWSEKLDGQRERLTLKKILGTRPARAVNDPPFSRLKGPLISPQQLSEAKLLQSSSFEQRGLDGWKPVRGSWLQRSGSLLGFGRAPSTVQWLGPPLKDLIIEGRFRLDPVQHYAALIYVRVQDPAEGNPEKGFLFNLHFRQGIRLLAQDSPPDSLFRSGDHLQDKWFPFRANIWYSFRVALLGNSVDFYVDDQWMLSSDRLDRFGAGKILLGSSGHPVEFDDVKIYSLEKERSFSTSSKSSGLVRK